MQVPLGTTIKLLDKVFAKLPVAKHAARAAAAEEGATAIDTTVSPDFSELVSRFAPLRQVSQAASRLATRAMTPNTLLKLHPDASSAESRRSESFAKRSLFFLIQPLSPLFVSAHALTARLRQRAAACSARTPLLDIAGFLQTATARRAQAPACD